MEQARSKKDTRGGEASASQRLNQKNKTNPRMEQPRPRGLQSPDEAAPPPRRGRACASRGPLRQAGEDREGGARGEGKSGGWAKRRPRPSRRRFCACATRQLLVISTRQRPPSSVRVRRSGVLGWCSRSRVAVELPPAEPAWPRGPAATPAGRGGNVTPEPRPGLGRQDLGLSEPREAAPGLSEASRTRVRPVRTEGTVLRIWAAWEHASVL